MNQRKEQTIAVIFSTVGCLAIILNLNFKGFTPINFLDALKDLVGLSITIAVFLIAYSISSKSKSYLDSGLRALEKLKSENENILLGPEYDKSDYNPEEAGKSQRMKYLFFAKHRYIKKVAFIPLEPIEQGILDIRVSKATLVNFGYDSKDAEIEKAIQEVQAKVYEEMIKLLSSKYNGLFEILNNNEVGQKSKYPNSAIVIDFNEDKMKFKGLEKAVYRCALVALQVLIKHKK